MTNLAHTAGIRLDNWRRANYRSVIARYYRARRFFGLPTLKSVRWLSTLKCNFACRGCVAQTDSTCGPELSTEEAESLVREMAAMGVRTFEITGGEPLLRPDLFHIIRLANRLGIGVGVGTNSYLARHFESEFRRCRFQWIFTSIDGLRESSDAYRGRPGAFDRSIDALDLYREIGVPLRIVNTVVTPGNIDQLDDLYETIRQSGANLWHLAPCLPLGGAADNPGLRLDAEQFRRVIGFAARRHNGPLKTEIIHTWGYMGEWDRLVHYRPTVCRAGIRLCAIMPDGEVLGYQVIYDNRHSQGNIRERPLREIWREEFRELRDPVIDQKCRRCEYFKSCAAGCWILRQNGHQCLKHVWAGCSTGVEVAA